MFQTQPLAATPKTLTRHLADCYLKATGGQLDDSAAVERFVKFADDYMRSNPPVGVGYGNGMTVSLQKDNVVVLIAPPKDAPQREARAYGVTGNLGYEPLPDGPTFGITGG